MQTNKRLFALAAARANKKHSLYANKMYYVYNKNDCKPIRDRLLLQPQEQTKNTHYMLIKCIMYTTKMIANEECIIFINIM